MLQKAITLALISLFTSMAISSQKIVYLEESGNSARLAVYDLTTKITNYPTVGGLNVIYPTISSDGSQVAFSGSKDSKNYGIYIVDLNTNQLTEVVAPKGLTIQPTFSGNGRRLGYTAPVQNKNQIHVLDLEAWRVDSSTQPIVLNSVESAYYPCLSSAGFFATFHLSYKENDQKIQQIAKFDIKEGEITRYSFPNSKSPLIGKSPCFSFDDREIVFTKQVGEGWNVFKIDINGETLTQLTNSKAKDYAPRFFPDGSLLFSSNRSGKFQFYRLEKDLTESDGAQATLVHFDETNIWDPRISGETNYSIERRMDIMGEPRSSFATLKHGNHVYVIGGHKGFEHTYPPESFSSEVHAYNLETKKWHRLADKINPVHGLTAKAHGNYIYAFGGFAYSEDHNPKWKSLDVIERYDISEDRWEVIGKLPSPRSSNAIAQIGNSVFLVGGWDATPLHEGDYNGTFYESIVRFDLTTEKAEEYPISVPKPARRAFTATKHNGELVIAGGLTQGGRHFNLLDQVLSLNIETGTWTELPSLPFPNFAPAIQSVQNKLFLFGGFRMDGDDYSYVNHIYNMGNSDWKHTGRYLRERKGFVQPVLLDKNTAGLLGGHTYDTQNDGPVSTFEVFQLKR